MQDALNELVSALLLSGRIQGVPDHLRESTSLRQHLGRVLYSDPRFRWLVDPLVQGLLYGVHQRGATFTFNDVARVYWAAIEYVFRGGTGKVRETQILKGLIESIIGFCLPLAIQEQVDKRDETEQLVKRSFTKKQKEMRVENAPSVWILYRNN
jgi:hypothetical protein